MINYKDLKNKKTFFLIAGPCVVESKELVFKVCNELKKITDKQKIPFVFKASYSKANRTSAKSFRSIGVDKALEILSKVRKEFDVPVLTDVHSELDVELAAEAVDILQIPAFLSRQTELLEAAGNTGKIVNIKKGQFLSPFDMEYQAEKVALTGNKKILLTERGSTFGYNNLIVDFRGLPVMKNFGYPVVFDATHSVQMPSKESGVSGGNPEFIEPLAKAALAAGADGIFIETHPNPSKALSDGSNMIKLTNVQDLLIKLKRVFNAVNSKA
jgi:2-dehydro-3-deoxyphosphooctonate aldolase (KDO 8-P synthase)